MNWFLAFLILMIPATLTMGVIRLLGVTKWGWLLAAAIIGGALAGAFISSAASAMATAVDPQTAALRSALIGVAAGGVSGGVILLIARTVARS